jgi:hypothetical protein
MALTVAAHTRTMLRRRSLMLLPLLAWPRARARAADLLPDARASLGGIEVPAERARQLAAFPLGGVPAAVLAFAADLAAGERDLLVVVAAGRLVALEVLMWRGTDGSRLYTRASAVSDGLRLRLERTASAPRGRGYYREQWTDYLAWQENGPMADAPVRPVRAGTWQAALATQRAGMRAALAVGLRSVPPALIAACPPPAFPL